MPRLNQERQEKLELLRMESTMDRLRGYKDLVVKAVSHNEINIINLDTGNVIKFWPYSGWHTGKDIQDGRGFKHLETEIRKLVEVKIPPIIAEGYISPRPPMPFVPRPYQKETIDKILRMSPEDRAKGLQWGRPRYVSGIDFADPNSKDKTVVSTMKLNGKGGITKIWFDEFSSWPSYKWYRQPIRWYRWRRTMKLLDRNQAKYNKKER